SSRPGGLPAHVYWRAGSGPPGFRPKPRRPASSIGRRAALAGLTTGNLRAMTKTLAFPIPEPEESHAGAASDALIEPHGGRPVDLLAAPQRAAELKAASRDWPSWDLT